ncbi:hypothetical protein EDB84DRAFT_1438188 [Lactarius hengduanensis]|nr:hypothetical protein EDB84DRAFT_1438188 [Lactarius hengduanensis]
MATRNEDGSHSNKNKMTLKLRLKQSPSPAPFTFDNLPPTPPPSSPPVSSSALPPPTSWLTARDMKIFGADPLNSTSEIGIVQCKDCAKPILCSAAAEHAGAVASSCSTIGRLLVLDNCKKYDFEKNGSKGKADDAKGKKRKGEDFDPNDPNAPKSKKAKAAAKVTKEPTMFPLAHCKSHSMGAKRAVKGRSKDYDELLLEWNRAHNPNWVEPVKRESKKERKEKRSERSASGNNGSWRSSPRGRVSTSASQPYRPMPDPGSSYEERLRTCRDLFAGALMKGGASSIGRRRRCPTRYRGWLKTARSSLMFFSAPVVKFTSFPSPSFESVGRYPTWVLVTATRWDVNNIYFSPISSTCESLSLLSAISFTAVVF